MISSRSAAEVVRRSISPHLVPCSATFRAHPPMVADELRRQADTFVELQDITKYIAREARRDQDADDMPDFVKNPPPRGPTPANPEAGIDDSDDLYEDA